MWRTGVGVSVSRWGPTANSKQCFTTYFLQEAGAGKRCSECGPTAVDPLNPHSQKCPATKTSWRSQTLLCQERLYASMRACRTLKWLPTTITWDTERTTTWRDIRYTRQQCRDAISCQFPLLIPCMVQHFRFNSSWPAAQSYTTAEHITSIMPT